MIELIIGVILGLIIMFFILLPKIKVCNFIKEETKEEQKKLEEQVENTKNELYHLDQEAWELSDEIAISKNQLQSLKIDIASYQARKEELIVSLEEIESSAQQAADAIYEKSINLMSMNLEESAEKMRLTFQQAEQDYQKEYLQTLEDLSISVETEMQEKKEQLARARLALDELAQKITAAVAANKRALEIQEEADFYKIIISQRDLNEIKKLREIIPYLKDQEALNKVIWKVYYEKPTSDLIGRVIGQEKKTGIYKITDTTTNKCYVGQCVNAAERWRQHIKRGLGAEPATRNKLYPAMAEKGVENFTFELIEECDSSQLDEREDFWQEYFHAKDFGYSIK